MQHLCNICQEPILYTNPLVVDGMNYHGWCYYKQHPYTCQYCGSSELVLCDSYYRVYLRIKEGTFYQCAYNEDILFPHIYCTMCGALDAETGLELWMNKMGSHSIRDPRRAEFYKE